MRIIEITTRKKTKLKAPTTLAEAHKEGPSQGTNPALAT